MKLYEDCLFYILFNHRIKPNKNKIINLFMLPLFEKNCYCFNHSVNSVRFENKQPGKQLSVRNHKHSLSIAVER